MRSASNQQPSRKYVFSGQDRPDHNYTADEMQDISDLLRSLVTEMKYYETVTGRCYGSGSYDSQELSAILEDESAMSPLNIKGAMLFVTQLVSQTMTHLLRSEIDLKISREQYDMLSKRIENLEMGSNVSGNAMDNKRDINFFVSPIQESKSADYSTLSRHNIHDTDGSKLTRQDLSSMFNETADGDETPIIANSSAANKILQQYAFGKYDIDDDVVVENISENEKEDGEPADSGLIKFKFRCNYSHVFLFF